MYRHSLKITFDGKLFLLNDEVASKLLRFMKDKVSVIFKLVNHAEKLAEKLKNNPGSFVLCHSDIHGGNVLVSDQNSIYIVDWDEPMMAPKERDLMFIGGGVNNVWNKPHEVELFYQGYGATKVNMDMLSYYRNERIVTDIAIYGQELLLTAAGGTSRQDMLGHFIAMFEPNGVVDIAFNMN